MSSDYSPSPSRRSSRSSVSPNSNRSAAAEESLRHDAKPQKGTVPLCEIFRFMTSFDRATCGVGVVCAFCAGATSPVFMYFFGRMTTFAYGVEDMDAAHTLRNFALMMTCIGVVNFTMTFIHSSAFMVASQRQTNRMKIAYFGSLLSQDLGWHDVNKPGALISRLYGDTRVIHNGISSGLASGFTSLGTGVVGFILAFVSCWELAGLIVASLPLVLLVMAVTSTTASRYVTRTRQHYAIAGAVATEVMENIKTVQTFNRESYEADRFAEALLSSRSWGIRKELMVSITMGSTMGIMFIVFGISFIFASYLVEWGRAEIGKVASTFFAVIYGASGFGGVFPSFMGLTEARTAAFPIFQTIDRPPRIDIEQGGIPFTFDDCVEISNVTFAYPTRPDQNIFENLNVRLCVGDKIAFSGATGCGKSTILALLQRFYDPIEGAVLVDGVDLRDISVKRWRRMISVVSQEPSLFSGSVLDNVRIGKANATEEEVILACKRARIHATIMALPHGYHTAIGAVGGQLSGGQKQRLAIARAIVRRSRILLLDEATSALDRKSEVEVQAALDDITLNGNMTVVTIAHRLATIRRMDCIYFLDNDDGYGGSSIVEYGTYDELVSMNGRFASMTMMQDTSCGDLRTVVNNTSFYLYPAVLGSHEVTKNDLEEVAELGNPEKEPEEQNIGHKNYDNWSQMSDVQEVPFNRRTAWEVRHTNVSMFRLMKLTSNKCWAIVLALIGSIFSAVAIPICALIITMALSALGKYGVSNDAKEMHRTINIWAPILMAVGVFTFAAFTVTFLFGYAGEHLTYYLRTTLFHQILRQDASFFDQAGRDPGTLGAILAGECEAVHQLYGPALGSRLKSVFSLIGAIVIGCIFEWRVALVAFSVMPLMIAGIIAQQIFLARSTKRSTTASVDGPVNESISAIRTVNAFNMKDFMLLKYKTAINLDTVKSEKRFVIMALIIAVTEFISMGSIALAYWYGSTLIAKGEAEFMNIFVAVMAIFMGSAFAGAEAGSFATKMRDANRAARNVFSIIDRVPDVDPYEYGDMDFGEGCTVDLNAVGFRYPARDQATVLEDLNLHFKDATSNGLMGQTGCGKSTIIQMLSRFYLPTEGLITVNGKDITTLDMVTWRDNISVVLQEPNLFSGTVRENIKYSCTDASDEEMYEAAKIACIHEDVLQMDDGYDTQVGYRGRELSGGQKQRVAIARGVLRCPKLLLLDEATSALDNVTEAAVQLNINAYQRRFGVTIVSIAHRLTTIQHCDQIVLLDSGKIIEHGTHEELMSMNGEYRVRWELTQQ